MGASLSSHWPRSCHGPGGDVLRHLGPAFLLTVPSHWPEKTTNKHLTYFEENVCQKFKLILYMCKKNFSNHSFVLLIDIYVHTV